MKTIILGPPGTGKTTTLLNLVDQFIQDGVRPKQIGYFSFTKRAATEAASRAADKFGLDIDNDLAFFRTLHSYAFNQLGMTKEKMLGADDYREFGEKCGIPIRVAKFSDSDGTFNSDNEYLTIINTAAVKRIDLLDYYDSRQNILDIERNTLFLLAEELKRFKKEKGLKDFNDLLEDYIKKESVNSFKVLFIDEAQDLSLLQWEMVRKLWSNADKTYIAGDDDQAIYRWNGAHVSTFINLEGERTVLDQSQRVPQKPFQLANKIIKKVHNRVEKEWLPKEEEGFVDYCSDLHEVDFSTGRWLVLAQANYMLAGIGNILDEKELYWQRRNAVPRVKNIYEIIQKWNDLRKGIPLHYNDIKKIVVKMTKDNWDPKLFKTIIKDGFYDIDTLKEKYGLKTESKWDEALNEIGDEDIKKIKKLIKSGENLDKNPRISISTIHGVKGNERENVVVITDLAGAAFIDYEKDPDDTHRLFYVACTRTEKNLYIIEPQTKKAYNL